MGIFSRLGEITDDMYLEGPHTGPNRSSRRSMRAKVRKSHLPEDEIERRESIPGEARHLHARPASDFPRAWRAA